VVRRAARARRRRVGAGLVIGALLAGVALAAPVSTDLGGALWVAEGQPRAQLGWAVSGAGDVDGDGFADLAVGAPSWSAGEGSPGQALVFHGGRSGPTAPEAWVVVGTDHGSRLGSEVAPAGDLTGDGYDDLLVTEPGHSSGARVHLYPGGPGGLSTGAVWAVSVSDAEAALVNDATVGIAAVGDVDGDGFADVVVGANGHSEAFEIEGAAWLYPGGPGGPSELPSWQVFGGTPGAHLGRRVAALGDVNGDGYRDFALGSHNARRGGSGRGEAWVFHGGPAGPAAVPDAVLAVDQDLAFCGGHLEGAGDVDGDGFDDVLLGCAAYDEPAGNEDAGAVFLFRGGPDGVATEPSWSVFGQKPGARLGASAGGDVDGDGFSDVLVGGAGDFDDLQTGEGRVRLFRGSATGPGDEPAFQVESNVPGVALGHDVALVGDVDGEGCSEILLGAPLYGVAPDTYTGLAALYRWSDHLGPCAAEPSARAPYSGIACGSSSPSAIWILALVVLCARVDARRRSAR
jgi:hypothetical protein